MSHLSLKKLPETTDVAAPNRSYATLAFAILPCIMTRSTAIVKIAARWQPPALRAETSRSPLPVEGGDSHFRWFLCSPQLAAIAIDFCSPANWISCRIAETIPIFTFSRSLVGAQNCIDTQSKPTDNRLGQGLVRLPRPMLIL
jgi:hypothetical protein